MLNCYTSKNTGSLSLVSSPTFAGEVLNQALQNIHYMYLLKWKLYWPFALVVVVCVVPFSRCSVTVTPAIHWFTSVHEYHFRSLKTKSPIEPIFLSGRICIYTGLFSFCINNYCYFLPRLSDRYLSLYHYLDHWCWCVLSCRSSKSEYITTWSKDW